MRFGINDAMRKVHKILNNNDPNKLIDINSKVKYEDKIRILEDECFYYRINVSEEVRPCLICNKFISLKAFYRNKTRRRLMQYLCIFF